VLRMDPCQVFLEAAGESPRRKPEQSSDIAVPLHAVRGHVPYPGDDPKRLLREPELLAALDEGRAFAARRRPGRPQPDAVAAAGPARAVSWLSGHGEIPAPGGLCSSFAPDWDSREVTTSLSLAHPGIDVERTLERELFPGHADHEAFQIAA